MEIKYLWGTVIALVEGTEDIKDNWKFEEGLALTRKTDVYQHRDMMQDVRINVCYGGFAKRFRTPDDILFYGESVSCNVSTPDGEKGIARLMSSYLGARYWKAEFGNDRRKHTVFLLLDKALVPSKGFQETNPWSETTHAEMREIIQAESRASNGF